MHHDISFDDQNTIRSNQFGDIYFSTENGVAETIHVFLDGNTLPQAWKNQSQFTIAETGFGTGLNILCAWKLFEETAQPHQRLDIISTEKFPLKKEDMARALEPFKNHFGARIDTLIQQYPLIIPGFHRLWLSDRVTITLVFDDAANALSQIDTPIDAWFLDGFAPAKNPEMWSPDLFTHMARLSHDQTTFATFTAAGDVKRGLEDVGFNVEKTNGFGRKRDMLIGRYTKNKKTKHASFKKVAIIGAGLAGAATAYCLKRRGIDVTVFEKNDSVGNSASSNQTALINPKLFADPLSPQTQMSGTGYSFLLNQLQNFDDIDFSQTGSIYLGQNEQKVERYQKLPDLLGWSENHLQAITASDVKKMTGYQTPHDGIFYPDAASVNPQKLTQKYCECIDVKTGQSVTPDDLKDFDAVVIANGTDATKLNILSDIPFDLIRGQVTYIKHPKNLPNLRHAISYGGYVSATHNEILSVGATFDRETDQATIKQGDNTKNLELLAQALPDFDQKLEVIDQWAGVRCSTSDYFPVIGQLPNHPHIYTHLALGSAGTVTSLIGAELIASELTNAPLPLSLNTKKALLAQRFYDRKMKRI